MHQIKASFYLKEPEWAQYTVTRAVFATFVVHRPRCDIMENW